MEVWVLSIILSFTDPKSDEPQFVPLVTQYESKEDCEAAAAYAANVATEVGDMKLEEVECKQQFEELPDSDGEDVMPQSNGAVDG